MTAQNVARLQEFFDLVSRGEMASAMKYMNSGCVTSEADGLPYGGDYIGGDGFLGLFAAIAKDFDMTVNSSAITDTDGDAVLAEMTATLRAKRSGRSLDTRIMELYTFNDGLLTSIDVFYKDTKAVAELLADEPTGVDLPADAGTHVG